MPTFVSRKILTLPEMRVHTWHAQQRRDLDDLSIPHEIGIDDSRL